MKPICLRSFSACLRSHASTEYFTVVRSLLISILCIYVVSGCGGGGGGGANSTIGPGGGTVISANGKLRLTVPAGALGNPTTISLTEVPTGDPQAVAYMLEPNGLAFAMPVTASLNISSLIPTTKGNAQPLVTAYRVSSDGSTVASLGSQSVTTDFDTNGAFLSGTLNGFSTLVALVRTGFTVQLQNVPDEVMENSPFPAPLVGSIFIQDGGINFDINAVQYFDGSSAPVSIIDENPFQVLAAAGQQEFTISRRYVCGPAGLGMVAVTLSVVDFIDTGLSTTVLSSFVSDPNALDIPSASYGYILRQQVRCVGTTDSSATDASPAPTPDTSTPAQPAVIDIDITNADVTFNHNVGVTSCPQSIGFFTITNTGTVAVELTVGDGTAIASRFAGSPTLQPTN
jgi:hypothetical protein